MKLAIDFFCESNPIKSQNTGFHLGIYPFLSSVHPRIYQANSMYYCINSHCLLYWSDPDNQLQ